jgi:iron-sulfur cluster repair protein YtfE (RIC family)
MEARVGDRLIIKGHTIGQPDRDAEVLEVRGPGGGAPYVVRWSDSGHETLFFPGPDATVQHLGDEPAAPQERVGVTDLVRAEHEHLTGPLHNLLDVADALGEPGDSLPAAVREAYTFLAEVILPHAKAEESTLYPEVGELLGTPHATDVMTRQHVEIRRLVDRVGQLRDDATTGTTPTLRRNLQQALDAVHAVLTLHLATEEELYLPLIEAKVTPRRSAELAERFVAAASHQS